MEIKAYLVIAGEVVLLQDGDKGLPCHCWRDSVAAGWR